jgi:hypothetical protein
MRSLSLISIVTAWLVCAVAESGFAAEPPQSLYDGAMALQLNELVQKSRAIVNPETLPQGPFRLVTARIEEMTGLQVWIDEQALIDAGVGLSLNSDVPEWPAGDTIAQYTAQLSSDVELGWSVHDRIATLTTREKIDERYVTRQYPIIPLLRRIGGYQPLFDALEESTCGPWDADEPGTGTLTLFSGALVVRQIPRVHQEVSEILAGLDHLERVVLIGCSQRELELRRLLEERVVSFDSPDVTLEEFVQLMNEMTGARFRIDEGALTDAGLDNDTQLVARAVSLPLHVALHQHLSSVNGTELTVVVTNDECLITTAEKASEMYETVIYNVGQQGISGSRIAPFIATLEQQTSGPWDADEPGTGTICSIDPLGVVVIRQTQRGHREILEMLRDLRKPLPQTAAVTTSETNSQPESATPAAKSPCSLANFFSALKTHFRSDDNDQGPEFEFSTPLLLALVMGGVAGYFGRHWGSRG